jgi:hypothetical protein
VERAVKIGNDLSMFTLTNKTKTSREGNFEAICKRAWFRGDKGKQSSSELGLIDRQEEYQHYEVGEAREAPKVD